MFAYFVEAMPHFLAYFAVGAPDMTIEQLSWFVDDQVTKRLLAIDGIGKAERNGGVDREIRVILDPARMQSLGVTAAQVNNALRQVNINAAGGRAEIAGMRGHVALAGQPALRGARPLFVGLVNPNTQGGVFLNSAPSVSYLDADDRERSFPAPLLELAEDVASGARAGASPAPSARWRACGASRQCAP